MTPYEKLRSLPGADGFLKPGITVAQLDVVAHAGATFAGWPSELDTRSQHQAVASLPAALRRDKGTDTNPVFVKREGFP